MIKYFQNQLLFLCGWFFVILGVVGMVLPLMPTTVFLIVALACFSKSSPRFHQMLLDNAWVGPPLRQWEETKTIERAVKYKASALIVCSFALSIAILYGRVGLQLFLVCLAMTLLACIWRIKEH